MSVGRCMKEISSAEYTGWAAYHRVNPIGGLRGDIQAAVIAQQVDMLVQFKTSNRARQLPLTDFMPLHDEPQREMTPEEMLNSFCLGTGTNPGRPESE